MMKIYVNYFHSQFDIKRSVKSWINHCEKCKCNIDHDALTKNMPSQWSAIEGKGSDDGQMKQDIEYINHILQNRFIID